MRTGGIGGAISYTCALNRKNDKTCIGAEGNPNGNSTIPPGEKGSPVVCHESGPIDTCLAEEYDKAKNNQDCNCDDVDGKEYDEFTNNSIHWVNRRLESCGSSVKFDFRGNPQIIEINPPYSGGDKNSPPYRAIL